MNEPLLYIPTRELRRVQHWALAVGVVATAICIAGAFARNEEQFFRSYLLAFLYWTGMGLGCLAIMMLHNLTSGAWGVVIRRVLESASRTLLLMGILFIPLAFGFRWVYGWFHPSNLPAHQLMYLNTAFVIWRAVIYFVLWIGMAYLLSKWSGQQDTSNRGPLLLHKMRVLSGPGLVVYGLTASFAAVDWVMSLEPRWFSTIIGMLYITGQLLYSMAFVIVVAWLLSRFEPFSEFLQPRHVHDLGKLLLTFLMLWAYMAFSQLLVIWEGNLSDEIPWYLRRWSGGWAGIGLSLIGLQFFLPFFVLLSRNLKRQVTSLAMLAIFILIMQGLDLFWLIVPEFTAPGVFQVRWMDILLPIGIGGLWCAVFIWHLQRKPLIPVGDPQLAMALKRELQE